MNREGLVGGSRWLVVLVCSALLVGSCSDASGGEGSSTSTAPVVTATTRAADPQVAEVEPAAWPTGDWPVSTPEEQGMDSGLLARLVERIVADRGIDSVMVVRNGYVVLDAVVYPFPADTAHDVASVTKSVIGTLIGIAIDRGLLADSDVPVVELLAAAAPRAADDLKASMTVEDLLTMSTGLDCRDSYLYNWRGLAEMQQVDDWTAHVLALPMSEAPGTRFEYCNGSSFLLSAILSEVTGEPAAEFAAEVLFAPLGITDFSWPANPDGITIGWGGLALRPSDMARIGYLYLRDGKWDGDQLVSQAWVEAATTKHIGATESDGYGYQWWVDDAGYFMALGVGGQHIIVVPDRDLVVVFTAGLPGPAMSRPEQLTADYILRAVVADGPLAPNPDAHSRLTAAVASARSGPESAPPEIPELAEAIEAVRYEFRPNDFGNSWFIIGFGDTTAHLELADVDGPIELLGFEPDDWADFGFEDVGEPIKVRAGIDGRFVIDQIWGLQMALRGAWATDDTFVIEYQSIGRSDRGTFEFRFGDATARLTFREVTTGTVQTSTADQVG